MNCGINIFVILIINCVYQSTCSITPDFSKSVDNTVTSLPGDTVTSETTLLSENTMTSNVENGWNSDDLVWDTWTTWTACPVDCGGGTQARFRLCSDGASVMCTTNLTAADGFSIGYAMQWQTCNSQPCPVDGVWTQWTVWSACSSTCGFGTQQRSRNCTGPFYGGLKCNGDVNSYGPCFVNTTCPRVDMDAVRAKLKAYIEGPPGMKQSDYRPAAQGIGAVGLSFVILLLVLLILVDLSTVFIKCCDYCHHTPGTCGTPGTPGTRGKYNTSTKRRRKTHINKVSANTATVCDETTPAF